MLESLIANPGELHAMLLVELVSWTSLFWQIRLVDCVETCPGGEPSNQPLPNTKLTSPNAQELRSAQHPSGNFPPGSNPSY